MRKKIVVENYIAAGFETIDSNLSLTIEDIGEVKLCHFPYMPESIQYDMKYEQWRPKKQTESLLLHGHVHEKWKTRPGLINVGVDVWDFSPVSIQEIKQTFLYTIHQKDNIVT